jgi:hypothetical protein
MPRRCRNLSTLFVREDFIDVSPTVEQTHDFRSIISQTIEHDLGARGERAEACPDVVPRSSCEGEIVDCCGGSRYFAQDFVGSRVSDDVGIVSPRDDRYLRSLPATK